MDSPNLSNAEIQDKLMQFGYPAIPVTPTTRKVLLKKLNSLTVGTDFVRYQGSGSEYESDETEEKSFTTRNSNNQNYNESNFSFASHEVASGEKGSDDLKLGPSAEYLENYLNYGRSEDLRPRFRGLLEHANLPEEESSLAGQPFASEFVQRLSQMKSPESHFTMGHILTPRPSRFANCCSKSGPSGQTCESTSSNEPFKFNEVFSPLLIKNLSRNRSKASKRKSEKTRTKTDSSWFKNYTVNIFMLLVFVSLAFGANYLNVEYPEKKLVTTDITYPSCYSLTNPEPGVNCINDENLKFVIMIFKRAHEELLRRFENRCFENVEPYLSNSDIIELLDRNDVEVEKNLGNLRVLIDANSSWKMVATQEEITLEGLSNTLSCYVSGKWIFTASLIGLVLVLLNICYHLGKWRLKERAKYNDMVYEMASCIVEVVSSLALNSHGTVRVSHVHDQLIPHKDRKSLAPVWAAAVAALRSDSRLRMEVRRINNEEVEVWHWLASS